MNTERPSRIGAKKTYAQLEQENKELKLELRQLRRENKRIVVENMSLRKGVGSCSKTNEALKGNGRTTEITDRMDTTYTQNYTEKGRDTFDAHDVVIDKDLLNDSNTFTSPVNKRNLSCNLSSSNITLNSSRRVYGSNVKSRLSTSPFQNKTLSNIKTLGKMSYIPKRYKGLKTSFTKPNIKFRKPLSISPSRVYKLKMNSPENTEDGSSHLTPYVLKRSSKRQSFLPSPKDSNKFSLKYTPKPTSTKLYRDPSNKKLYKTATKNSKYREEEKKGEIFEPSSSIKNRKKQKQAFLEEQPKSKEKIFSGVKKPKISKKKMQAIENRK